MKLKILLLMNNIKDNWFVYLELLIRGWLILSVIFVNGYICETLKIPWFFAFGISIGIGWHMTQWLMFKRTINIFINKEILEEIKKLP